MAEKRKAGRPLWADNPRLQVAKEARSRGLNIRESLTIAGYSDMVAQHGFAGQSPSLKKALQEGTDIWREELEKGLNDVITAKECGQRLGQSIKSKKDFDSTHALNVAARIIMRPAQSSGTINIGAVYVIPQEQSREQWDKDHGKVVDVTPQDSENA